MTTIQYLWTLLISNQQIHFLLISVPRLFFTALLCGIIGYEREHVNRPAGIRTHVLVGISSAVIILTSEFMQTYYAGSFSVDPSRMGAQIISGIGFLGAGTIIKDGLNVRGLTTAATLWAVACIGIATGSGFYSGAILATAVIYFTLQALKQYVEKRSYYKVIFVTVTNIDNALDTIVSELEQSHISINSTEIFSFHDKNLKEICFHVSISSKNAMLNIALENIRKIETVTSVNIE